MLQVMAQNHTKEKPLSLGQLLVPIWGPFGNLWVAFGHHFGVLEAPVEALCDLVGRHCLHGRVWVRFEGSPEVSKSRGENGYPPCGELWGVKGGGKEEEGKDLRRLVDPKGSADFSRCCML